MEKANTLIAKIMYLTSILVTIALSFGLTSDPINLIKFVILVSGSCAVFAVVVFSHKSSMKSFSKSNGSVFIAFVLSLTVALLANSQDFVTRFFGEYGRNTGYLAYLSLSVIFYAAAISINFDNASWIAKSLLIAGVINILYGIIQFLNLDPGPWENPFNPIIGTLGNPNFASSLIALALVVAISISLQNNASLKVRLACCSLSLLGLFLILKSNSSQGVGVFLLGLAISVYQRISKTDSLKKLKYPYLTILLMGSILAVMGTLQSGPLKDLLYQESITYRGDYWKAGIAMFKESPIFGLGIDSYGNYYREFRTAEAVGRRGPEITSNAAHNVFIDMAVNGGLLLLASYIALIILAVRSSYRLLSRSTSYQWVQVSLVATWAGYLFQSLISINQLGLAIWGWLLPGAIIGLEANSRSEISPARGGGKKAKEKKSQLIPAVVGSAFGLVLSGAPLVYDFDFKQSIDKADPIALEKSVRSFPQNNYQIASAAVLFENNGYLDKAQELYRLAYRNNPRDFAVVAKLYKQENLSDSERDVLLKQLQKLDPHNPSIPRGQ